VTRPSVNAERLWDDLMALGDITDPERPYTRRSFSPRFLEGRDWLRCRFEAAGLDVRLDAAANLIGRRAGRSRAEAILLGSHSDSVPAGGRFDGPAGLLAALEVARALGDSGIELEHPLEVIDFLAEEPSEYGVSCVGSRALAGALEPPMLQRTDAAGEKLGHAIDRIGGNVAQVEQTRRADILAYIELHIEQGVVLETRKIDLGIVTGVVGIARIEIVFEGAADHAGTMPMGTRKDAGLAAAQLISWAGERARELAQAGKGYFVATAGIVEIAPNAANVVPKNARVVFDVRAERDPLLSDFLGRLEEESRGVAVRTSTKLARWTILSRTAPTVFDAHLRQLLQTSAEHLHFSRMPIASGAGHDAAFVSRVAPSAMLFIPCRQGKSHAPEEWAEPAAVSAGAATMLEAVLRIDRAGEGIR
jgi:beta-ureidopropionase / N-carbamoyl-L-amino-acid hydrolase